ncbi:hypothetical protein AJ80_07139 [Polytolypa hystricis UAMH7299]|uniref:Major facilitator superfamily (MFS) profile domain-containing protein n=1 Tax=Polytolypa hystricis (strain UAMH7299) TaxID=1447883 RepID=A0A2B7XQW7_POLH7|nr:hypothetical protein AJ80_07139 [Polytolypa hystricis UAMH7299]
MASRSRDRSQQAMDAEPRAEIWPAQSRETDIYDQPRLTSTSLELRDAEKRDGSGQSSTIDVRDAEEIQYPYLTFETVLPAYTPHPSPESTQAPFPEQPDLRPYISPFLWPKAHKSVITCLSCAVTCLSAMGAGCYSPPAKELAQLWGISHVVANLGITVFTTGFAIAPMVLAPFSEINGRKPMFILSGILFSVCQMGCGLTNSFAGMLLARFFLGVGGSTFSTIVGGVLSDIYISEDRNTPMALFSGAALFGTGLGPLIASMIIYRVSWRWVFYSQAITGAVLTALIPIFFKETRGSVLLSRKAKVLNAWYEELEQAGYPCPSFSGNAGSEKVAQNRRIRWKVRSDEERESLVKMISISLYRPFHLLVTEPVVFFFSLWVAFSWAILYLQFGSIPLVFETNHNFNIQESGAVFAAICIGAIIATFMSIGQEKLARRLGKMTSTPEGRLYFACIESIAMPVGLFWFGWTSFSSIHWVVPTLAVGCATIGIFSIYLAVFNYLADTYHRFASSALAAQSFCRNLLGGIFPLVVTALFNNLGFPAASSLLGGIGALLTIVPWVLVFYGPKIRARSKIASEIMASPEVD